MRPTRTRIIVRTTLLALGVVALLAAHSWIFKPLRIDWFYARTFAQFALHGATPELARASLATLLRYDRGDLDREGRLEYDTLDYVLSMQLEGDAARQLHARRDAPADPAYYAWCVRRHTATELTPNQAHELGVAQVQRLHAQVDAAAQQRRQGTAADPVPRRVVWRGTEQAVPLAAAAGAVPRMTWARYAIAEAAQAEAHDADFFAAYRAGAALFAAQAGAQAATGDDLAYLQDVLQRAVYGVVDSGLHERRWTHEQARAYLLVHGAPSATEAAQMIERVLAHPGRALAAPVGLHQLLELRDRAAQALGAEFDLGQFQSELLRHGALPFGVLEAAIDAWIAGRQAAVQERPFAGG
jgi:uncharacterized protein (DUF885 family)